MSRHRESYRSDQRGERGTKALLTNSTSSEYGFAGNFLQAVA